MKPSVLIAAASSAAFVPLAAGCPAAPTSCSSFDSGTQVTYSKSGPFDRYIATCNTNYMASTSPIAIPNVASYTDCVLRYSNSPDIIAATYRPPDGYCYCFYDYYTYQVNGPTLYDGAFKSPSTSTICNYVPPAVRRTTAANQARFVLYGSTTLGSNGVAAFIDSVTVATEQDCVNICASSADCTFFSYATSNKGCMRYTNNGGAGICGVLSNGNVAGVRVAG